MAHAYSNCINLASIEPSATDCMRDVELTRAIYRRMVFADYHPAGLPGDVLKLCRDKFSADNCATLCET